MQEKDYAFVEQVNAVTRFWNVADDKVLSPRRRHFGGPARGGDDALVTGAPAEVSG
jgi:hypothetical protein